MTVAFRVLTSDRQLLRAAVAIAATTAIVASGITACSSSGTNEVIVSSELAPSPKPEQAAAPVDATPAVPAQAPASQEASEELRLVWTEVDLSGVFGPEGIGLSNLDSVGDGRVFSRTFDLAGSSQMLVTDNGVDWTEVPIPSDFSPLNVDITGDRWVIQGFGTSRTANGNQIFYSDDRGANWTHLDIDLGPLEGKAGIISVLVAGERIVVAAQSDEVPEFIEDQEGDTAYESNQSLVHLFFSDGGPTELVAEYPGWILMGYSSSDGFHLVVADSERGHSLTSPDGRQWNRTIVDFDVHTLSRDTMWTKEQTGGEYRIERFDGVYGPGPALTIPDGISWIVDLAVGPAGIAAVAYPETTLENGLLEDDIFENDFDDYSLPSVSVEKDGYELRYNEPENGITLWGLSTDTAVYVFGPETLESETPPEGSREVEGDDGTQLVVFEDPETGADLVTFTVDELMSALDAGDSSSPTSILSNQFEQSVGWSEDGTDWVWQSPAEAFGLPESAEDKNSVTEIEVAVGQDFVIAKVHIFELPPIGLDEDTQVGYGDAAPASTSDIYTSLSPSIPPPRWFIARVE